jgi:NAD(P)H-hydrate epimerase
MQELPTALYQAEQVRELDRLAIAEAGIAGFELMRRAGRVVYQCLHRLWPKAQSIAVFCGSGNNAGDGFIVAELAIRAGLQVRVYCLSDPDLLKGDALCAYHHYRNANGSISLYQSEQEPSADVLVDALFGTGLGRSISGLYLDAIKMINRSAAPVIAVDIPSGLNANTGAVMGEAIKADCTVSFIGLKQGLFTGHGPNYCGEIHYASLDVPDHLLARVLPSAYRVVQQPWPRRQRCAYKGDFGHVLIIGGCLGYSGAVRLAGEAALRIGAGLVSVATCCEHAVLLNSARPELMCHGVQDAGQLEPLLAKADVVVLGPGLGQSEWAKTLFWAALRAEKKMVIDADGLNILAQTTEKREHWVLTPHPGEAGRLLGCSTGDIQQDRYVAASALQQKYGGIVVLKGVGTLIAARLSIAVSSTGNPGMASGGMGDVLAGVIAGLIAQGFSLPEAAQQGVYGHGWAADRAAGIGGERGLLASDLMPFIRQWANA